MPNKNKHPVQMPKHLMDQILKAQETEITEHFIYSKLAQLAKDDKNRRILEQISNDEKRHAVIWQKYTGYPLRPHIWKMYLYSVIAKVLGFTFSVKLMEKGEESAQINYHDIQDEIPEAKVIQQEENDHEKQLLGFLDEDRLKYIGSMVLGVNDALVELTGALAGLTLALQNSRLIAIIGLITGIAASLSMGASEYLSTKAEGQDKKDPVKASIYTGFMYIVTVILLIIPYYLFTNIYLALSATLSIALLIILFFTFYISVAQDLPFKKRFLEMAGISLGVSLLTFGIGYVVRQFLGVDV